MAEEGYDVEAVSDTSHDMYCVICLKLMRNAIQMNCGHGMCDACFHKLVKYAKERKVALVCPSCRKEIIENKVFQVPMFDRIILALQVKCENSKMGCDWIGELGDMEMHKAANCNFQARAQAIANIKIETCPNIIPKHKSKGADICGTEGKFYIIRPDVGYYLRSSNFNQGTDLVTYKLHDRCKGEHYLSTGGKFYIIQGDKYRRVTNMNLDKGSTSYSLHPNCKGGDVYLCAGDQFVIISFETEICHVTSNMNNDDKAYDIAIPEDIRDALYHWGGRDKSYCLKQSGADVEYCRYKGFDGKKEDSYPFHHNVMCFIPGGLAVAFGASVGFWKCIHSEKNETNSSRLWSSMLDRKDGFHYEMLGLDDFGFDLCSKAVRVQFLDDFKDDEFITNFLNKNSWHGIKRVKESVRVRIHAGDEIHVWQYVVGFKNVTDLFFTPFVTITDNNEIPTQQALYEL